MGPVHSGVSSHAASRFAHPERNVAALGIDIGMKVADFGAGSGAYVLAIAEVLNGSGIIYAVDIQKDLLRRIKNEATRRNYHNVEVIWGDIEKRGGSKIKEGTIDVVLVSNLLFQLGDKDAPFIEAKRILKPHGRLVVIDWNESYGGLGPTKQHVFNQSAAERVAAEHGFSLLRTFSAGAHHYGLIFTPSRRDDEARKLVVH